MITQVHIKNFKAIRDASVDLTPIHLLIGPNHSGKTSVLEAIAAICRSVDHDATNSFLGRWQGMELVNSNSAKSNVDITLKLIDESGEVPYRVQLEFPGTGRDIQWIAVASGQTDLSGVRVGYPKQTLFSYPKLSYNNAVNASKMSEWPTGAKIADSLSGCWYLRWTARNLAVAVHFVSRGQV